MTYNLQRLSRIFSPATKRGSFNSIVSCFGKCFYFSVFRLIFRQKNITKVPYLHSMLSLILKTTCVVFLETFLIFLQAYRGFQFKRNHHGDLYNHYCLKSKLKVFIFFPFRCVYNVRRSFCLFPGNTAGTICIVSAQLPLLLHHETVSQGHAAIL